MNHLRAKAFTIVELLIVGSIMVSLFGLLIFAFLKRNSHAVSSVDQALAFGHVRRMAKVLEVEVRQAKRIRRPAVGETGSELVLETALGEVTIGLDPAQNLYKSAPTGLGSSRSVNILIRGPGSSMVLSPMYFRVRTDRSLEMYTRIQNPEKTMVLVEFFDAFRF